MAGGTRNLLKKMINALGFHVRINRIVRAKIPDRIFYAPLFSPWLGYGEFKKLFATARPYTVVSPEACYQLYAWTLHSMNLDGQIWECGVYRGGTARLLSGIIELKGSKGRRLRLFDTFSGMPEIDPEHDLHHAGDFQDCSFAGMQEAFLEKSFVTLHKGLIPETFVGLEGEKIALAHIDVDIYQSVRYCCEFIYPLLVSCGVLVFDDYGMPSCPGAKKAVDEFFSNKPENPIVLPTGQAIVVKLPFRP